MATTSNAISANAATPLPEGVAISERPTVSEDTIFGTYIDAHPDLRDAVGLQEYSPTEMDIFPPSSAVEPIAPPDTVLVNKLFGVNVVLPLSGPEADYAIISILADAAMSGMTLGDIKTLFWNNALVDGFITTVWSNKSANLSRGRGAEQLSSTIIDAIRDQVKSQAISANPLAVVGYAHVVVRVLSYISLASFGPDEKYVYTQSSWIATPEDVRRASIVKNLQSVFNEAKYKEFARSMGDSINPTKLAGKLKAFFRDLVASLDHAILNTQRYDQATQIFWQATSHARSVPLDIRTLPEMKQMGRYANLVAASRGTGQVLPALDPFRAVEALKTTSAMLAALPDIEPLSSEVFSSFFGFTPAANKKFFKGGVAWTWLDTKLSFDLLVSQKETYAKDTVIAVDEGSSEAGMRSRAFKIGSFGSEGVRAVARLLSHGIVRTPFTTSSQPILRTFGVTDDMIEMYALVNTKALGVVPNSPTRRFIYTVDATDRWLMRGVAATDTSVMLGSPKAAFLHLMGAEHLVDDHVPKGIKIREQRPIAGPRSSTVVFSDKKSMLIGGVMEPFVFTVTLHDQLNTKGQPTVLKVSIPLVAHTIIDEFGRRVKGPGDNPPKYVAQPAVDMRVRALTGVVSKYLGHSVSEYGKAAEVWWYTLADDLGREKRLTEFARQVVSSAFLRAGHTPLQEGPTAIRTVLRAYLGVIVALLQRYGRADGTDVLPVITKLDLDYVNPSFAREWASAIASMGEAFTTV